VPVPLGFDGNSVVNLVVLASAVVPPIVVLVVTRVAWVWSKNHDGSEDVGFAVMLRRALWLPEPPR
jgi:hypothetical protein